MELFSEVILRRLCLSDVVVSQSMPGAQRSWSRWTDMAASQIPLQAPVCPMVVAASQTSLLPPVPPSAAVLQAKKS